jgi:hypothetical protein
VRGRTQGSPVRNGWAIIGVEWGEYEIRPYEMDGDMNNIIGNPIEVMVFEESEIWVKRNPKSGEHIKVSRGVYTHHGIFIGYNEVIHFASKEDSDDILGNNNEVISTSLNKFLRNGILEVKEYLDDELDDLYPVHDIISYARHCIGDKGYNLIFNNCEHFANSCTLGRHRSKQVENVLGGGKKMGFLATVSGFLGGLFGGKDNGKRETISTIYEPDKVRVAEINAQANIIMEKLKGENIKINAQMQKELVTHLIEQEKILMQAKLEGFNNIVDKLASLSNEMIMIRMAQTKELEAAQSDSEKEIVSYYEDFKNKLEEKNRDFDLNHLPKLNEQRGKYEEGSASWKTYGKLIDKRLDFHFDEMQKEAKSFREQREKRLESSREIRRIVEIQLGEITKKTLELVDKKSELIELKDNERILIENAQSNFQLNQSKNNSELLQTPEFEENDTSDEFVDSSTIQNKDKKYKTIEVDSENK